MLGAANDIGLPPCRIADHARVATAQCQSFEALHVRTTTIGAPKFGETSNDPTARFRPARDLRAPDIEATAFLLEMLGRRPWLGNTACPIASHRVAFGELRVARISKSKLVISLDRELKRQGGITRAGIPSDNWGVAALIFNSMSSSPSTYCGRHVAPPRIRLGVADLSPDSFIP
jgi:hypothetical protein